MKYGEAVCVAGVRHKRPGQFMVVGAFYTEFRPDAGQLTLDLAS